MIEIAVIKDGKPSFLALPDGVRLSFEHINSAINFDFTVPGVFHMGLKLPAEPNAQILGQAHHLESAPRSRTLDVEVYHFGVIRFKGKLVIQSGTVSKAGDVIDCDLIANGIGVEIDGVSIRQLIDEQVNITTATVTNDRYDAWQSHVATKHGAIDADQQYCFPQFVNLNQYNGQNDGVESTDGVTYLNWYLAGGIEVRAPIENPEWNGSGDPRRWLNTYAVAPSVYVMHMVKKLGEFIGYTMTGDYFNHPDLRKEIMVGLYSADKIFDQGAVTLRKSLDTVYNATFNNPLHQPFQFDQIIQDNNAGGYTLSGAAEQYLCAGAGQYFCQVTLLIHSTSSVTHEVELFRHASSGAAGTSAGAGFINTVAIPAGDSVHTISFVSPNMSAGQGLSFVFTPLTASTLTIKASTQVDFIPFEERRRNVWADGFNLANCVPDVPVKDWLKNLKLRWGLHVVVDDIQREMNFGFVRDIFSRKPVDITDLVVSGDYQKQFSDSLHYTFKIAGTDDPYDEGRVQGVVESVDDLPSGAPISERHIYYVLSQNGFMEFSENPATETYEWQVIRGNALRQRIGSGQNKDITIRNKHLPLAEHDQKNVSELDTAGNSDEYGMGTDGFDEMYAFFYGLQPSPTNAWLMSQTPFSTTGAALGSTQQTLNDALPDTDSPFTLWKPLIEKINGAPSVTLEMVHSLRVEDLPQDRLLRYGFRLLLIESITERLDSQGSQLSVTCKIVN